MSVVILALLCLRPVLGKRYRAKAFYWIWLILALRLAVPLNPSLPQAPVRLAVPDPVLYAEAEGAALPAVHPAEPSPLMTGLLRPVLLLPEEQYSPQELTAIFHHELIHARRRDLWYKLLLLLAQSVHWFNTLVHSMARRAEQDLEISCDEAVVAGRSPAFQAQYGRRCSLPPGGSRCFTRR